MQQTLFLCWPTNTTTYYFELSSRSHLLENQKNENQNNKKKPLTDSWVLRKKLTTNFFLNQTQNIHNSKHYRSAHQTLRPVTVKMTKTSKINKVSRTSARSPPSKAAAGIATPSSAARGEKEDKGPLEQWEALEKRNEEVRPFQVRCWVINPFA